MQIPFLNNTIKSQTCLTCSPLCPPTLITLIRWPFDLERRGGASDEHHEVEARHRATATTILAWGFKPLILGIRTCRHADRHTYIHRHTYVHTYIHTYKHYIYIWRPPVVSRFINHSNCRCMYVRTYVCMYVCLHVCMYVSPILEA